MTGQDGRDGLHHRSDGLGQRWAQLTRSPLRVALVVGTAIAAVATGVLFSVALSGTRDVGSAPSDMPSASVAASQGAISASATGTPSTRPSASPTSSPSESAEPSATGSATETATPSPGFTPIANEPRLTGTWERLPDPQQPDGMATSAALLLDDGRIAVLHWRRSGRGGDCVAIFEPSTGRWRAQELGGELAKGCFSTNEAFAAHPDGRFYSLSKVVDPTLDPWLVEWAPWRNADVELPDSIGTVGDGRLYGPLNYQPPRMYEYLIDAGDIERVSEYDVSSLDDIVAGTADRLYIGTMDVDTGTSPLFSWDPTTDDWRTETPAPFRATWERSAHGPEGWIYVPGTFRSLFDQGLWARDPANGQWFPVELPEDAPDDWSPAFVDGGDGRLYAMDPQDAYVFTPVISEEE